MKGLIIIIGASIIWLSACAQEPAGSNNQEGVNLSRVSKTEFKKVLSENPEAVLIDVRTPGEFKSGKIENATNIDFMDTSFELEISKLNKNELTLIYCQSGGRSGKALTKMKELGFTDVRELEGGYSGW